MDKAAKENIIDCSLMKLEILKSVKLNRPKYSEVYVETPMGEGVVRLLVDPFLYYLYTSDADDNVRLQNMVREGRTYLEAVEMLSRKIES